jgi:hypothetical protein
MIHSGTLHSIMSGSSTCRLLLCSQIFHPCPQLLHILCCVIKPTLRVHQVLIEGTVFEAFLLTVGPARDRFGLSSVTVVCPVSLIFLCNNLFALTEPLFVILNLGVGGILDNTVKIFVWRLRWHSDDARRECGGQ